MPNHITITRGAAAVTMRREEVPFHAVFAVKRQDRLGKQYASLGSNGRMYSVNVESGDLASSGNGDSNVQLVGKWDFKTTMLPTYAVRSVRRSEVRPGEIFVVKNGTTQYAHIGRVTRDHNGWLSIPLSRQENHAVTENGNSMVDIVGHFTMDVRLTK